MNELIFPFYLFQVMAPAVPTCFAFQTLAKTIIKVFCVAFFKKRPFFPVNLHQRKYRFQGRTHST